MISCEYPPQVGGVGDYTALLCQALRDTGDSVHVWAPAWHGAEADTDYIHRALGDFDPQSLEAAGCMLDLYPPPRTLLLQWVPHGYGRRSMNLEFCRWIERRVRAHGDKLQLIVHEPALSFGGFRQSVVSLVHRWMLWRLLHAAERAWLSTPAWEPFLSYLAPRELELQWLPIPSNIPYREGRSASATLREELGKPAVLLGHFGTYSSPVWKILEPVVKTLLAENSSLHFLLIGSGGQERRDQVLAKAPELTHRLHATGCISRDEISAALSACDLLVQPYPDGATSRRTSLMAGLSHGVPVLSTFGRLSEPLWKQSNAIALTDSNDVAALTAAARRLIGSPEELRHLGVAGRELYRSRFDVQHTIAKLRRPAHFESAGHIGNHDRLSASITPTRSSSV